MDDNMQDKEKSREQLIKELESLSEKVKELERLEYECRKIEDSLRKAEYDKAVILRSVTELITYQDRDLRIIWANRAAGDSVGRPPEALTGRHCYEIWFDRTSPCEGCPVRKAMETGESQEGEMSSPDGREWFVRGYPVLGEEGEITGAVEVTTEITARKRAEINLKKSEEKYKNIIERSFDAVIILDQQGMVKFASPQIVKLTGYGMGELAGRQFREFLSKKQKMKAEELFNRVLTGEAYENEELKLIRKDGSEMVAEHNAAPVLEDNKVTGAQVVIRDVTERKKAEEKLKTSEERWRAIYDYAPVAYFIYDLEGRLLDGNRAWETLVGYRKEEVMGRSLLEAGIILPEQTDKAAALLARNDAGGSTGPDEFTLVKKDGRNAPVEITTHPIKVGEKMLVMGVAMDITERRESEKELQKRMESLEKFQKITVGRELRVRELKERLKDTEDRLRKYEKG